MLFCGFTYYPYGGWEDFKGYFDSLQDCQEWVYKNITDPSYRWVHIVHQDKIVLYGHCQEKEGKNAQWAWRKEE